ncbi:MAG: hypothetical protein AAFX06_10070 [Planctomycetota bacterium]
MSKALFSARAGLRGTGRGKYFRAYWPLGQLQLSAETLALSLLIARWEIPVHHVRAIQRKLFSLEITHSAKETPNHIRVWGLGLYSRLARVIEEHQLDIEVR